MVLLTVTEAMLEAIAFCNAQKGAGWNLQLEPGDPDLGQAKLGGPITHHQVIEVSKLIETFLGRHREALVPQQNDPPSSLESLLRHSKVYKEPPPPKAEPTSEYKSLMARLREQEEAVAYERMLQPLSSQAYAATASAGASLHSAMSARDGNFNATEEEEELTYADVNRQMALIINVLLSILACSVAIWMVAAHLNTAQRLALSMCGSGLVGIAEVVVYAGYLRRVREAKEREKLKPEIKEVMETWVIESNEYPLSGIVSKEGKLDGDLRQRKRTS